MTRRNRLVDAGNVVIVDRTDETSGPIAHGRSAFLDALSAAGATPHIVNHWTETDQDVVLAVGTTESRVIARLLGDSAPERSIDEGVVYQWCNTGAGTALVIAGTSDRGLQYALLELAERVNATGITALSSVDNLIEFPDNRVRGISRFIETPVEDEWLYDDEFWEYYLDRLARNRFNRLTLVTGYDTPFMSPPYPFVVDVPGFPDVQCSDAIDRSRAEHRDQLRHIGERCHAYGLEFIVGIWQQQPWTDYQGVLVDGLPEGSRLAEYCSTGLETLLVAIPEIDGVQLRVNHESGVTGDDGHETAEAFWMSVIDAVAAARAERGRPIGLDLRAKGLTDAMIDHGLANGLDITVPTKFWCESTGLPYHNTEMRRGELANLDDLNRSRRYSYADLLEKPRAYDMLYRLWATGTNRIFLWGDPDYARRFSQAASFGEGIGFEVTTPLSLKGGFHGLLDERWQLHADPSLRHYEWEDERYWAWYRLFGRLGYSRETDAAVWEREFESRFGEAAESLLQSYRAASKILPLITAFHLTSHPALHNWAELDTGGALFAEHNYNETFGDTTYSTAEPSDPGLFYRIDEYVADSRAAKIAGKYTPPQIACWLASCAEETRQGIEAANQCETDGGEFRSTILDLTMLSDLAMYHANKIHAALALCHYQQTGEKRYLPKAYSFALTMQQAWSSLAEHGDGTYHDDLVFGQGPDAADSGNWTDRLIEIRADVEKLEGLLEAEGITPIDTPVSVPERGSFGSVPLPTFALDVPASCVAGEDVHIELAVGDMNGVDDVRLHYRHTNQLEGAFKQTAMQRSDVGYQATIPGAYVTPEWDLLVYASAVDRHGDVAIIPGLYHHAAPMPYHVIETLQD